MNISATTTMTSASDTPLRSPTKVHDTARPPDAHTTSVA
jgi:hypothetical protein